jgi:hypothetical protein
MSFFMPRIIPRLSRGGTRERLSADYADVRGLTGETSGGAAQPRDSEKRTA